MHVCEEGEGSYGSCGCRGCCGCCGCGGSLWILKGRDLVNRMDVVDLEGSYGSWPLCSTIYMCVCVCECVCVPLCSTIYIL